MEAGKKNGGKTGTTGTGPSSSGDWDGGEEAVEHKIQQQKMEDDQMLLDAGIGVEGMGDEEKRQILEALRQSLPAPKDPEPSTSEQTLAEDNDSEGESAEVPEDTTPPARSLDDKDEKEEVLAEDAIIPPADQSLEMWPVQYDSDTREEGEQECDSTTTTTSVTAPAADDDNAMTVPETGRSRHPETGEQSDDVDSLSDEVDTVDSDLLKCAGKGQGQGQPQQDMRLSSRQKEQGQSRFKELFNRTRLSQSLESQSAVKDRGSQGASVHSSQDLFIQHSFDDTQEEGSPPPQTDHDPSSSEARPKAGSSHTATSSLTAASATVTSPASPSPSPPTPSSPARDLDRGGKEEGEEVAMVVGLEDAETLPPEDYVMEEEGEEKDGGGGGEREEEEVEEVQSSPVYPMQVTQVSCSTPSPDSKTSTDDRYLTPSKLPVKDDKDKRPLLHDNWFSWPPVPPVYCLHRTYRRPPSKGTEPPSVIKPYFCPERERDSVAAYSEVIVCMLDSYLQQFSTMQRCLHTLLPWGKPVRAGLHQQGTLDCKRRGQPAFHFDFDEDDDEDDDFQAGQPPPLTRKKLSSLRRKRKASGDDVAADGDCVVKVKTEAGVGQEEGRVIIDPGDGGDNTAAYNAETQPLDSDSDLPDLNIEPDDTVDSSWGRRGPSRPETRCKTPSPMVVSEDSQQSSNSLLNEQGELYSTQLPRRKRAGPVERDAAATGLKRQRKTTTAQPAGKNEDRSRESPERLRLPSRKRKQATSSKPDSKVYIVDGNDDDDEVSFPQKVQVRRKRTGFVSISSTVAGGGGDRRSAAVVHPVPQSSQSRTVRILPITVMNDDRKPPQPSSAPSSVSSSSEVRGGGGVGEDSEDSVQYLEPPTDPASPPPPPPPKSGSLRAEREERRGQDDWEDGDHGAMAARHQAQEPAESAHSRPEEMIACPLCSKLFKSSVIEAHASDCSLLDTEDPQQEDIPLPSSTAPIALPPASLLKRRPLRSHFEREEFVCPMCGARQGGSGALRRHRETCKQRHHKEDKASCSTSKPDWLHAYKIPIKVEGAASSKRLPSVAEEDDVEINEGSDDDSNKDPTFRPTEDDRNQEREEEKVERQFASRHSKRPGPSRELD